MGVVNFDSLDTTGTMVQENAVQGNIKCSSLTVLGNISSTGFDLSKVGTDLTAVGSNRGTSLQLDSKINNVTSAAASTGVTLPVGVIGMTITVANNGANAIQVYASGSETINATAGSTGVALAATKVANFMYLKANTWISVTLN